MNLGTWAIRAHATKNDLSRWPAALPSSCAYGAPDEWKKRANAAMGGAP